eukprot:CAMPEP_0170585688 /NCGR_PEP_ID=MMETSP0224-20130122/9350_1 /TAXON_ID=285029 /ORGANISM="Togula jolla, Strain CCCM 725" /LENGTH=212 /DNA_ID=CAMNT_0010909195 /DNA_START=209 /DNA_END=847 /DNA_ORIENTATION=-
MARPTLRQHEAAERRCAAAANCAEGLRGCRAVCSKPLMRRFVVLLATGRAANCGLRRRASWASLDGASLGGAPLRCCSKLCRGSPWLPGGLLEATDAEVRGAAGHGSGSKLRTTATGIVGLSRRCELGRSAAALLQQAVPRVFVFVVLAVLSGRHAAKRTQVCGAALGSGCGLHVSGIVVRRRRGVAVHLGGRRATSRECDYSKLNCGVEPS